MIKKDIADLQKRLAKNHAKLSDEDIQGIINSTERLKYSSAKARQLAGDGLDE